MKVIYLALSLGILSSGFLSTAAFAETIRGGIDCKIMDQHYMKIAADSVKSTAGRSGGDGTGATLHLRYEITRPMVGQKFDFKVEFGRFDILFDETYPQNRVTPLFNDNNTAIGVMATTPDGTPTTTMYHDKIELVGRHSRLSLFSDKSDMISGLYQSTRLDQAKQVSHVMGLICTHKTNALGQIIDRLL